MKTLGMIHGVTFRKVVSRERVSSTLVIEKLSCGHEHLTDDESYPASKRRCYRCPKVEKK